MALGADFPRRPSLLQPLGEWAGTMTTEREGRGGVSRRDWGSGCKIPAQTLSLSEWVGWDTSGDKGVPSCSDNPNAGSLNSR